MRGSLRGRVVELVPSCGHVARAEQVAALAGMVRHLAAPARTARRRTARRPARSARACSRCRRCACSRCGRRRRCRCAALPARHRHQSGRGALRRTRSAPLRQRAGQRWFAPGAGTAAALRRRGIGDVHHPLRGAGAEALLAMPELQQLRRRARRPADRARRTRPAARRRCARAARSCAVRRCTGASRCGRRRRGCARSPRCRRAARCCSPAAKRLAVAVARRSTPGSARGLRAAPLRRRQRRAWRRRRARSASRACVRADDARPTSLLAALAASCAERGFR